MTICNTSGLVGSVNLLSVLIQLGKFWREEEAIIILLA